MDKPKKLQALKQSLLSRYNSFDPNDLARLQTMLPDQVNNIGLILDLDTLANQFGLSLENVGIDATGAGSSGASSAGVGNTVAIGASAASYESLQVTFAIHSTYAQFMQYVSSLETSLRIVDLVGVSVSGGGTVQDGSAPSLAQASTTSAQADNNIYTFSVTIRTYWLK